METEEEKVMKHMSRRRFLSVCAVAGTFAALPWANAVAAAPLHRWNGILLGAEVSLTLAHPNRSKAHQIFETCVREIKRLESIFTLYDSHSELSQLNKHGILRGPSSEMVDILEQSRLYNQITDGAFDVTVKPLEDGQSLDLVGMDKLHINQKEIHFEKLAMGVTLNGIAQGYITDRITELLKAEGLKNVLVELGEKRAIGPHPEGRPWSLALQGKQNPISLTNRALATSARKNADTGKHHIFKPSSGHYTEKHEVISVIADSATMADALSTGFMLLSEERIKRIQEQHPNVIKVYRS